DAGGLSGDGHSGDAGTVENLETPDAALFGAGPRIVEENEPRPEGLDGLTGVQRTMAAGGDDAVSILRHQQRRGIDAGETVDDVPRFAHRRRPGVRPRRVLEQLCGLP